MVTDIKKIIELKPLPHGMSCLNIVSISSFILVEWPPISRTQPGFIYVSQVLITFNICMFDYSLSLCEVLLVVPSLSCVWLFATPWPSACLAPLSFTVCRNLLKSMSIESVMLSNHLPLLSPSPLALNLSQHQGFSSELTLCIRWPKYWSFSLSISLSNEYSELISLELSGLISLHPRDSQKSSPGSQFKSISSSEGLLHTNYSKGKQKEIMK